jgi:rSAM/selenodomain-associated transferase 1
MFVKEPKLGFVKTRLAKSCGHGFVVNLYVRFVQDLIYTLQSGKSDFKLCVHPNLELLNKVFGNFDNFLQSKGNLGTKMQRAFEEKFQSGYDKIILIGSDTPHITNTLFEESFKQLDYHDVVLGPSLDGGYYLIGFNKDTFTSKVFEDIKWSTPKVLEQTLQKLHTKTVYLHQELNDIDILDDLKDFYDKFHKGYFENSQTIQFLEENSSWKNLTLSSSVEDQLD